MRLSFEKARELSSRISTGLNAPYGSEARLQKAERLIADHLHADHFGGLMNGDKLAFPNATVRADQHDADFWLSQANLDKAPADAKGFFRAAITSLSPCVAAGKLKAFRGVTELVPRGKALATPGHSVNVVESQGRKLVPPAAWSPAWRPTMPCSSTATHR